MEDARVVWKEDEARVWKMSALQRPQTVRAQLLQREKRTFQRVEDQHVFNVQKVSRFQRAEVKLVSACGR